MTNKETVLEILNALPKSAVYKSFKDGVYLFDVAEGMYNWQMGVARRSHVLDSTGELWKAHAQKKYSNKLPHLDVQVGDHGLIAFMQK